jgi:hypothetical protein
MCCYGTGRARPTSVKIGHVESENAERRAHMGSVVVPVRLEERALGVTRIREVVPILDRHVEGARSSS